MDNIPVNDNTALEVLKPAVKRQPFSLNVKQKRDSLKERAFIIEYIKNGYNGTAAMQAVNKLLTKESASTQASRYLQKKSVQDALIASMLPLEEDMAIMKQALTSKRDKAISWADTHRFLETSLKLKGHLTKDTKNEGSKVNVGLVFN